MASAVEHAVVELERHVARAGWDAPPRLFALVRTAAALAAAPALTDDLPPEVVAAAASDAEHLTSVEQEDLPEAADLEELLAQIGWPPSVDGAAVVVERTVLPPQAQEGLPTDPVVAAELLATHPDRREVRIAVAVLRDGSTGTAVRQRTDDDDLHVVVGADLVPGLATALRATLAPEDEPSSGADGAP